VLRPVAKKSLATSVFEELRDHILGGEARPGDTLPSERVLADMLKVNRGAVREGLRRLEQAGLVAVKQGGATQVLDFKRTAGLELLGALVVRSGRVDTRVARSVLELRSALGPEVARACARAKAARGLGPVVEAMRAAKGDLPALARLAMQFWGEVVRGADGVAWQLAYNSLEASYGLVQEHLVHVLADELMATDDYAALAAAIARGDERAAGQRAAAIVARGEAAVRRVLDALDAEERTQQKRKERTKR
jgi:DNA-binding FadR family transcriptional regulator